MLGCKPASSEMLKSGQLTFSFGSRSIKRSTSPGVPNQKDRETPSPFLVFPVCVSVSLPGSSALQG